MTTSNGQSLAALDAHEPTIQRQVGSGEGREVAEAQERHQELHQKLLNYREEQTK